MRQFTQKIIKAAAAVSLLAGAGFAHAQVDVDVDINVGEITILYSFTDIDVNIDNTALAAILDGTGVCGAAANGRSCDAGDAGGPVTAAVNGANLEANYDISANVGTVAPTDSVNLVLQNVWAVRAIGGTSANTTVNVTVPAGATLTTGGSSSIAVTNGTASPSTFADPGLGTPEVGDVTLTLDFTNLTESGNHDSGLDAGDTVYTIDVTAT